MTEQPDDRPAQAPDTPTENTRSATEAPPARRPQPRPRPQTESWSPRRPRPGSFRHGWRRIRDALATVIVIVAVAAAIILAVHVVFVVFEANAANGIVKTINSWADSLAWNFRDIFTPTNPKTAALVNYGLAAAIYLVVGRVLAALVRRAG